MRHTQGSVHERQIEDLLSLKRKMGINLLISQLLYTWKDSCGYPGYEHIIMI